VIFHHFSLLQNSDTMGGGNVSLLQAQHPTPSASMPETSALQGLCAGTCLLTAAVSLLKIFFGSWNPLGQSTNVTLLQGAKAAMKRERNAKAAGGVAKSQLKQNEAAKDIQCTICKATFLKTTREKAYVATPEALWQCGLAGQ
jgi:hypothetical protein